MQTYNSKQIERYSLRKGREGMGERRRGRQGGPATFDTGSDPGGDALRAQ